MNNLADPQQRGRIVGLVREVVREPPTLLCSESRELTPTYARRVEL